MVIYFIEDLVACPSKVSQFFTLIKLKQTSVQIKRLQFYKIWDHDNLMDLSYMQLLYKDMGYGSYINILIVRCH